MGARSFFERGARLACAGLLGVRLLGVAALSAQGEHVDKLPAEYEVSSQGWDERFTDFDRALDPRWPDNVLRRHEAELERGHHLEVLQALADDFRLQAWPAQNDLKERFQRRLDALVQAFREAQAAAAIAGGLDLAARDAIKSRLENDHALGVQSLLPELFKPDPAEPEFVLVFFAGTSDQIDSYSLSDTGYELLVPREVLRDLRLRAEAVRAVLRDFVAPLQQRAHLKVLRADRRWTNYLEHGYSQYPWEALLNGWVLDFDAFDPPRAQWILLHPALGVEVSTVSLDELTANEALSVELAGYVGYYGDDSEHYFGGSLAMTLTEDEKPGFGVVLHWEKSFSLGLTWRDEDDDNHYLDEDPFVFLSFDLFRYAQGQLGAFQEEYAALQRLR